MTFSFPITIAEMENQTSPTIPQQSKAIRQRLISTLKHLPKTQHKNVFIHYDDKKNIIGFVMHFDEVRKMQNAHPAILKRIKKATELTALEWMNFKL